MGTAMAGGPAAAASGCAGFAVWSYAMVSPDTTPPSHRLAPTARTPNTRAHTPVSSSIKMQRARVVLSASASVSSW
jgi:hypothetical protein